MSFKPKPQGRRKDEPPPVRANPPGEYTCPHCGEKLSGPPAEYVCPNAAFGMRAAA